MLLPTKIIIFFNHPGKIKSNFCSKVKDKEITFWAVKKNLKEQLFSLKIFSQESQISNFLYLATIIPYEPRPLFCNLFQKGQGYFHSI